MHLEALVDQIGSERRATPMPSLVLLRQSTPSALEASLYTPVLCLILQGKKQVALGEEVWSFGPGECLLVSHDLPVLSRVTKAPYLALVLSLDAAILRDLYEEAGPMRDTGSARAVVTHRASPDLMDALGRYAALADSTQDAKVLGPLILRELHYRLLVSPVGGMLRSLLLHDSHASAIARAIGHIRGNLRSAVEIPSLARRVAMSPSSFHKHFKDVTSTTPLQYQKELRLLEARRLLLTGATVATAAYDVGYESPSQFSREYTRKFGGPPSKAVGQGDH